MLMILIVSRRFLVALICLVSLGEAADTTQLTPAQFNVQILENKGTELAQLIPYLNTYQETTLEYLRSVCQTDPLLSQESTKATLEVIGPYLAELIKIQGIVRDKIIDIHYHLNLADQYTVVVAYDQIHQLPQAIGIVLLDREKVNSQKSIELYSLATSVWNLNCVQNRDHAYRVRGAGSSIIEFCKKYAAEHHAKYLYLDSARGALPFYERHGFKRLNSEFQDNRFAEDKLQLERIPLVFDLEESKAKSREKVSLARE